MPPHREEGLIVADSVANTTRWYLNDATTHKITRTYSNQAFGATVYRVGGMANTNRYCSIDVAEVCVTPTIPKDATERGQIFAALKTKWNVP